jgi:hypothetical protein
VRDVIEEETNQASRKQDELHQQVQEQLTQLQQLLEAARITLEHRS